MPHKNPRCPKGHGKMEHHKWIKFSRRGYSYFTEIWERIVKCPDCGEELKDWKARPSTPRQTCISKTEENS